MAETSVKLIVISPEFEEPSEHVVLTELFAAGLTHYHLRKPTWCRDQIATWLRTLPEVFHARIILHSHHNLASDFGVGGLHDRDDRCDPSNLTGYAHAGFFRSRAVHDLSTLGAALMAYDRLLLSPIFPSFSKTGYRPTAEIKSDALKTILALPSRAEVLALGGIDASRINTCRELGFDGVAVLGAIWQSADPLHAFNELNLACRYAHAA